VTQYSEALLALAAETVARTQLGASRGTPGATSAAVLAAESAARQSLEEMDDSVMDDDDETEWQKYLRSCVEIVMKVADLMPDDVLRILVSRSMSPFWLHSLLLYGRPVLGRNALPCTSLWSTI